jgi:hypothetical protein
MASLPKLDGAAINIGALRQQAHSELMGLLPNDGNSVAMVLDPGLSGPLGLIAEVKEFREHGVDKIYHLLPEPLGTDCQTIVYFVRPQVRLMPQVAAQIRELKRQRARDAPAQSVSIIFVPRRSLVCERVLQEEGVQEVPVREFSMQLIPLDDDVLSLEQPCFRELFYEGDRSALHLIASAILRLDSTYGVIPQLRGKGRCAQQALRCTAEQSRAQHRPRGTDPRRGLTRCSALPQVLHIVTQMRRSMQADGGLPAASERVPEIGTLLLVDRDVDLVSPLCTELT